MGLSLFSLKMGYGVVLLKERRSEILNRQSGEVEYKQGKKDGTWEITRGVFQTRKKSAV